MLPILTYPFSENSTSGDYNFINEEKISMACYFLDCDNKAFQVIWLNLSA